MSARSILHVDMDAFFASVEVLDDPSLRGRPVIVGGDPETRGVVAAASYEARRFGVHSAMSAARARRLCPDGVFLHPRGRRYAEISRRVFALFREYTPLVEPLSIDEAFLDVTGCRRLFGPGEAVGRLIKRRIRDEVGLVASVGVAPNKFLAKLASDLEKPDGFVVVPADGVPEFLAPLPVGRLWGVGPRTDAALASLGVRTVAELRRCPEARLRARLGEALAAHLTALALGDDDRPVVTDHDVRSIGHEITFARDIGAPAVLRAELDGLVEKTVLRLRDQGLAARTVHLKARFPDFSTVTRSATLPAATDSRRTLRDAARGRGLDDDDETAYLYEDVRSNRDVRVALNLCWMPTTPHGLLERLYARPDLLARHSPKFTQAERDLLRREPGSQWTISDIPILDELAELLGPHEEAETRRARLERQASEREQLEFAQTAIDAQDLGDGMVDASMLASRFRQHGPSLTLAEKASADRTWTFGHIVVDEAQELSPMAWRALLRRCPLRSMTVVGDLAQRSGSQPATSWRSLMGKAGREHVRQAALTVSYRTPATVLEAASAVLMANAPGDYLPLTAAREVAHSLVTTRGHWRDVLVDVVREELRGLGHGKMAVITPSDQVAGVWGELAEAVGEALVSPDGHPLRAPLVVMDPPASKGLEFDVVVVVEPAHIAAASIGDVYVAMTRPTRRLHAIYRDELPDGWPAQDHDVNSTAAPHRW